MVLKQANLLVGFEVLLAVHHLHLHAVNRAVDGKWTGGGSKYCDREN